MERFFRSDLSIFEFLTVFSLIDLEFQSLLVPKSIMNFNHYLPPGDSTRGCFCQKYPKQILMIQKHVKIFKNQRIRQRKLKNHSINKRSKFHNKTPRKSPSTPKNKQKLIPEIMLDQPKFPAKIPIFKISAQITQIC